MLRYLILRDRGLLRGRRLVEFHDHMITRMAASSAEAAADLRTYAAGVKHMKGLHRDDPLSWEYQSRMHGNRGASERRPSEPKDFSQCQHGTWWFLPWHRMYLLQLERIVAHVTETPGFALPYWAYPSPADAVVPEAFMDPDSPLFNESRRFPGSAAQPQPWLRAETFTLMAGVAQKTHLHRGPIPGLLEQYPHNAMHGWVGGDMASFQSPLDPLFWIHHCNIDRLWEIWRTQPGHSNPTDSDWLTSEFEFPDPAMGRETWTVAQVTTPETAGYQYDSLQLQVRREEFAPTLVPMGLGGDEEGLEQDTAEEWVEATDSVGPGLTDEGLELVGATATGNNVRDTVQLSPELPSPEEQLEGLDGGQELPPATLLLRLENVGIDDGDASDMWNVFITVGANQPLLVGTIVPFGLAGLTRDGGRQTLTFDVSGIAAQLALQEQSGFQVSFEPVGDEVTNEPYWERAALYRAGR